MTDFRELCAELVTELEKWCGTYSSAEDSQSVINRARAALAEPEPEEPTVMEIIELADEIEESGLGQVDLVRAALARWGRPAPQPVPVSERLPGPGDCASWPGEPEATPWCWAGKDIDGGWEWSQISMLGLSTDTLSRIIAGGGWTHWLPAHALPLPANTSRSNFDG
jgi:hypothetical protein